MKVRQNGETYSTVTTTKKISSPVLAEKAGDTIKYTPLVLDGETVDDDGLSYSYDSSVYPKVAAKFNGNIYHAVKGVTSGCNSGKDGTYITIFLLTA